MSDNVKRGEQPTCSICGELATCYGQYEAGPEAYACDDCCAHGNEDGWCEQVKQIEKGNNMTDEELLSNVRARLAALLKLSSAIHPELHPKILMAFDLAASDKDPFPNAPGLFDKMKEGYNE